MPNIKPSPTGETYAELQRAFGFFNERLFDGALPSCLITLQREKRVYGYFSSKRFVHRTLASMTDEIAVNPGFFAIRTPEETLSTLAHEMTHLWQFHFGSPGRRRYHNREWGNKMEALGLMPSSTGAPGGKRVGECVSHYIIPGGLYALAAKDLLATGLFVSWLDRFPYEKPEPLLAPEPREGAGGVVVVVEAPTRAKVPSDTLGGLVVLPGSAEAPEPNRSNRVKFRCPYCAAQAWGKPDLKLLCGEPDCAAAEMLPA